MDEIINLIGRAWDESGYNMETTQEILSSIKEALLEQGIVVEMIVVADDNNYDLIDK
jgi:hypothetical protein